jgi:multiple sugar transport system ATP-binding protein
MASLEVSGMTKKFGDVVAVSNLSFEIDDGEFIVIVGPSGCGKSTTLNCITGLEKPTEGQIEIGGEDVTGQRPQERDIAMVFQDYALYPHKSIRENLEFGLRMRTDMSSEERQEQVGEMADILEISDQLDKSPGNLSGGQQQRVALGRAIIRDPDVFLMDEPLSNLDAKLRIQMRARLQELHERLDATTIYVTHNQDEAMTMGDKIIILNKGELQQFATPLECYYQPENVFVAKFIGSPSMNTIVTEHQQGELHHDEFTLDVDDTITERIGDTNDVIVGIRPEDLVIGSDSDNAASATVRIVEPKGDVTNVHLRIGSEDMVAIVEGYTDLESGDEVNIGFPMDDLYLFDESSGEALLTPDLPSAEQAPAHTRSEA